MKNYILHGFLLSFSALACHELCGSLWIWYWSLNTITFIGFGVDKLSAVKGGYRIPEKMLLLYSVAGGWLGAILAQQIFRHKTKKQPFKNYFMLSVLLNLASFVSVIYLTLASH